MNSSDFRVTVYGARGSMAVSGPAFSVFGGDTSCYLVQADGESVFLDAGSGLIGAPTEFEKPPLILLSHLHVDHLLGLGMYPRLSQRGKTTRLFVPTGPGESPLRLLDSLYSPPYWPLSLASYSGDVQIEPLVFPLSCGRVRIDGITGHHPGGCAVIRIAFEGRSLVYCTDYEREDLSFDTLTAFAGGTDLLLYDGQYTQEQLAARRGFGHSTAEDGLELMARCGAKRLLLVHHDPLSTDAELQRREALIAGKNARYARTGEVIDL